MLQQHADELGNDVEHVLAVVEQQHDLDLAECGGQAAAELDSWQRIHAEHGGDSVHGRRVIGDRQLAHDHRTIGPCRPQPVPGLQEHARLAHATWPDQRHEPCRRHQRTDLLDQRLPTDERRGRTRQSRHRYPRGRTRRRSGQQLRMPLLQQCRRIDAELVGEPPAEVVVGAQRIGATTGHDECLHQQRDRAFAQRQLVDERAQRRDESVDVTAAEASSSGRLPGAYAQLVEAPDLGAGLVHVIQIRVGGASPPSEQRLDGARVDRLVAERRVEPIDVQVDRCRIQQIPVTDRLDRADGKDPPQP